MNNSMPLPEKVRFIFDRARSYGHRADIVGGCTRDYLLGTAPSDYDITTDATPDEIKVMFSDVRILETGIRHGTLTLLLDGEPYEVTTYRLDGEYKDNRHPESVSFTRLIALDLERRDFTMNAICYNDRDGFTDLFCGLSDIENRIIRAVGDPRVRFSEDALRIMRAIRFSSVLGFSIEPATADAAREKRELLCNVSVERIAVEWTKLVGGRFAFDVIKEYSDILSAVIPELCGVIPPSGFQLESDAYLRELSLFYVKGYDGPSAVYGAVADRLRYDNKRKKFGMSVLENANYRDTDTDIGLKRLLMNIGYEYALGTLRLQRMIGVCSESAILRLKELSERAVYTLSSLAVNGSDLIAIGISGKSIGRLLSDLLLGVVEERYNNDREELLLAVKELNCKRSKNGI